MVRASEESCRREILEVYCAYKYSPIGRCFPPFTQKVRNHTCEQWKERERNRDSRFEGRKESKKRRESLVRGWNVDTKTNIKLHKGGRVMRENTKLG